MWALFLNRVWGLNRSLSNRPQFQPPAVSRPMGSESTLSTDSFADSAGTDPEPEWPAAPFVALRLRPRAFYLARLPRLVEARLDIFGFILSADFRGLLLSRRDGARFLLYLTVLDWNHLAQLCLWAQTCLRLLLALEL